MAEKKFTDKSFEEMVRDVTEKQLNAFIKGESVGSTSSDIVQYVAKWAYDRGLEAGRSSK